MGRERKPPKPIKTARHLQLVPAPIRPSLANLGITEAQADELRALIRSINQRHQRNSNSPTYDDELPPAA